MKADRNFDGGGDGGPEQLRRVLRQWKAPGPPPELEEQLRQTFRRGRSRRRQLVWFAVAASLFLAAILNLQLVRRVAAPGRVAERPALAPQPNPAPPTVEPKPTSTSDPADVPAPRTKRKPARPVADDEVIVEPRQAELLVQFARQVRGTRQAGPGVSVPRIEVQAADAPASPIRQAQTHDDVRQHRTRWESVEAEWPSAQLAL